MHRHRHVHPLVPRQRPWDCAALQRTTAGVHPGIACHGASLRCIVRRASVSSRRVDHLQARRLPIVTYGGGSPMSLQEMTISICP